MARLINSSDLNTAGTNFFSLVGGLQLGTLADNSTRAANTNAINNAIVAAGNVGESLILPAGRIELYGPVVVNVSGLDVAGAGYATQLVQYQNNVPVVHVGPGNSSGNTVSRVGLRKMSLLYSADQTSNTGAVALELAGAWLSTFEALQIGDWVSTTEAAALMTYRGIGFDIGGSASPCFNNSFKDIFVRYCADAHLFIRSRLGASGTINSYQNIYCQNGTGANPTANRICRVLCDTTQTQESFLSLNLEHAVFTDCALLLDTSRPVFIGNLHMEDLQPLSTAAGGRENFVRLYSNAFLTLGNVNVSGVTIRNGSYNVSEAAVFGVGNDCVLSVGTICIENTTLDPTSTFALVQNTDTGGDGGQSIHFATRPSLNNNNNLSKISDFTVAPGGRVRTVISGLGHVSNPRSEIETVADASTTLYGMVDSKYVLMHPSAMRVVTLSKMMGFMASDANTLIHNGVEFRIICTSGSSGSICVVNYDATPLKSIAAGQFADLVFDGQNWVVVGSGAL